MNVQEESAAGTSDFVWRKGWVAGGCAIVAVATDRPFGAAGKRENVA